MLCSVLLGDKKRYNSRQEVSTVISKWCVSVGSAALLLLLFKCREVLPDFVQANHRHHHRCSLVSASGGQHGAWHRWVLTLVSFVLTHSQIQSSKALISALPLVD